MRGIAWLGLGLVVIVGGGLIGSRVLSRPVETPKTKARRGELLVSLQVTGQVAAKRAFTITAPRIRNIQITWLAPEGSLVKAGDPVVRFDSSQQQAELTDQESQLKISDTSLGRARQEYAIQEKQLALELRQAQRNFDEKKHEAPKIAEEAKLQLELAELKATAQLDQIKADVQKAELEVQRARDKVTMARKELEQMTQLAPIPGMAVYLNIWKGSAEGKVQAGDSPWPGQGLVDLPDLGEMLLKATVSEVDAGRVEPGLPVIISLDAVSDRTFAGTIERKGTLARRKDESSRVNVFDIEAAILDHDERLKPGMSASGKIVVERIPDVVCVPLEGVFEVSGKTVVYLDNKKPREVKTGRRNDQEIEIVSGLSGGETVLLVDPTLARPGMPGDKATEPELNKGRSGGAPAPAAAGASSGR
jgi:HlyD family secretion protein